MRTLLLSDLHLGVGGPHDIHGGGDALPAFLEGLAGAPVHVVLNGDTFDYLVAMGPGDALELRRDRVLRDTERLVTHNARTLRALGVIAARGALTIRLGNHDPELGLREVQDHFHAAMGVQRGAVAWDRGASRVLRVGGVDVVVVHGDGDDVANHIATDTLPAEWDGWEDFRYPAGSRIVTDVLHPARVAYGMRWLDFLKPDFEGAIFAAVGVDPRAAALLAAPGRDILWRLAREATIGRPLAPGPNPYAMHRPFAAEDVLSAAELAAVRGAFAAPRQFQPVKELQRACARLLRGGLRAYAALHRGAAAAADVDACFSLAPTVAELDLARAHARAAGARVVVSGHTHAARWGEDPDDGAIYVNTGTWAWLMTLPSTAASIEAWETFLEALRTESAAWTRRAPGDTEPAPGVPRHVAPRVVEIVPGAAGVTVTLAEITPAGAMGPALASRAVRP